MRQGYQQILNPSQRVESGLQLGGVPGLASGCTQVPRDQRVRTRHLSKAGVGLSLGTLTQPPAPTAQGDEVSEPDLVWGWGGAFLEVGVASLTPISC